VVEEKVKAGKSIVNKNEGKNPWNGGGGEDFVLEDRGKHKGKKKDKFEKNSSVYLEFGRGGNGLH